MQRKSIPGLVLLILVAWISTQCSNLVDVAGKHPLEASALAVVFGLLIRNLGFLSEKFWAGVKEGEQLLIFGVVLLGAGLNFNTLTQHGLVLLGSIIVIMALSYLAIYGLGRIFKLSSTLSLLLAVGTTICGTSAIAVTAPLIKAKDAEISYAVGTVTLWGLVAILLYPFLGHLVGASDFSFGVFAGTAIHSTPQVVGAGYIYSDLAGQTATAVKLIRNCFMAPLALLIGVWFARKEARAGVKIDYQRAFPWFLFGYFILAGLNTIGVLGPKLIEPLTEIGKFLIIVGMVGVGLSTDLRSFKEIGTKPLAVGLIGTAILAGVSVLVIRGVL